MNIFNILLFLLLSTVSVSYGWGMRGTIIGGEKGAMLPGAFLGLLIALFSGSELLADSPWMLAGIGALSMYCGGNMTYGETLHLSLAENSPHVKKGLIALFIKGGIWFGICNGVISLFISVIAGYYRLWQILVFFGMLPIFALLFYFIFNFPYDPEKGKTPRVYFSITRKETWGGIAGIFIELIVFSAVFRDWATVIMAGGAFISGAIGWVIGQLFHIGANKPGKNGKRLFEKLNQKNAVDAWKIMECVLGAIGGLGSSLTFILSKPLFTEKFAVIDTFGFFTIIKNENTCKLLVILYGVILLADSMQYFLYPTKNKKYNKKLLKMNMISKETYNREIEIAPEDSEGYMKYKKFCEKSEFAIYSIIPMFFCMLGSYHTAAVVAFPLVMLVLCQEVLEKCFKAGKGNYLWKIMHMIPPSAVFILILTSSKAMEQSVTILMYTLFYEMAYFVLKLLENDDIELSNVKKTVHGYFIACCIVINILIFLV